MSDTTLSGTPVEFDPFSAEFFNDPTELYRRMRDEAPVYLNEKYGFYALFLYEDVLHRAQGLAHLHQQSRGRPVHADQGP